MGHTTSAAYIFGDSRSSKRLAATARKHVAILVLVLLANASLVGCQSFLEGMQQVERNRVARYWSSVDTDLNRGLGRHKDDIVRSIGIPTSCIALRQGAELCEWVKSGVSGGGGGHAKSDYMGGYSYSQDPIRSWEDRIAFTFDTSGLAREWTYAGRLGRRTSNDSRIGYRQEEYRSNRDVYQGKGSTYVLSLEEKKDMQETFNAWRENMGKAVKEGRMKQDQVDNLLKQRREYVKENYLFDLE